MKPRNLKRSVLDRNLVPNLRFRITAHKFIRPSTILLMAATVTLLFGCGGKNGLVGGGQGNPVFLTSISMTPVKPTISLAVAPQSPSTTQFVVMGTYNVGNPKEITNQMTWLSLDTKVATVDAKGVASAAGSGRVVIMAQIFEPANQKTFEASTILTVVPQLTSVTVSPATTQIAKGTTQQFTATGKYNDGTQVDVTSLANWTSSQPSAATVSSSPGTQGRASAVLPGTSTITASIGSFSSTAALTVTDANLVSLAVTPSNPTVPLASSQQFTATGHFDDGTMQDISATASWTSSNAAIGRVTSTGIVTGIGLGNTDVTASAGGLSDTTTAIVDASSVAGVSIVPVAKIASGTRLQMRAAAIFKDGGTIEVTRTSGIAWSSSNTGVATVMQDTGLVTATGVGAADISAKLGNQTGTVSVNVADAVIQGLSVAPNQALIAPGTTQNVIALASFKDGLATFQQDISNSAAWSSDNKPVATVSFANGLQELANAAASGTANLSAAFMDQQGSTASGSAALNVSSATLSGINVAPGSAGLTLGGGHQLIAAGTFSDGTVQDLTMTAHWSAADQKVAQVSPFGFAQASGPGQTSIAAILGAQSGSSSVVVNPGALVRIDICAASVDDPLNNCPPLDPLTPPPPTSFAKLVPYPLIAIGTYTDGSRADLTSSVRWSTSNPLLAAISNDSGIPGLVTGVPLQGAVTGIAAGHVTISASTAGVSGATDVIVTDATPGFLAVTPMNNSVALGLSQSLKVVATFSDSTIEDVTSYVNWVTSDPAVAVVYPGGIAYTSGIGTATVTAQLSGAEGSTTISVH